MPTGHGLHVPHFHGVEDWMIVAALPAAILLLGLFGVLVCSVIPWS